MNDAPNLTGDLPDTPGFHSPEFLYRAEAQTSLCLAIQACDPHDAAQIIEAVLEQMRAGDPPHTAFGDIRADAQWWADMATPAELNEYHAAALRKLGRTALCLDARKRLLVTLWASLNDDDRQAFLARVDPAGQFRGRAAA